jgi:hypothetical protein
VRFQLQMDWIERIVLISRFDAPLTIPIVRHIIQCELCELNYAN